MGDEAGYKRSTPEELAQLRETFNALDQSGSGSLDAASLTVLLDELSLPKELTPLILFIFDTTHCGGLHFEDFVEYMESMADLEAHPRRFFRLLFDAIDADGSGLLDRPSSSSSRGC
jgi:Ca2+-binding EF-hand superfamily protein